MLTMDQEARAGRPTFDRDLQPPPGWGSDRLTNFIGVANQNGWATFFKLKEHHRLLSAIDETFYLATQCLDNKVEAILEIFMLFRSHSAYLAAVNLAIGGQVRETFPVLRACLEDALYAYHFQGHPSSGNKNRDGSDL